MKMERAPLNIYETETSFLKRFPQLLEDEYFNSNIKPNFLLFQWHITNQCNLRCLHCYQNEYTTEDDLSFEKMKLIFDQYIALLTKWDIKGHINLTGGEPFLNNHFFSLLEQIFFNKRQCNFAILSNGTFLTDEYAKDLKKFGCSFFQISVEGDKEIHDNIRGQGNFEKCIKAIEILKKNKIQTMVSFTASKRNVDSFDEVVKFCKRQGVNILWSDRYLPMGKGKEMNDELLQPKEVERFFNKMYLHHHRLQKKLFQSTELKLHRALNFLVTDTKNCVCYKPYKCSAGRSLITVLPNGDLVPCRRMPIIVGNVLTDGLENLYNKSVLFKKLRKEDLAYSDCENCSHWKECKGGLRCLSYAYHGNPFKADPQCFKRYTELPDIE